MASHDLETQHKVYAEAIPCSLRTAQRHSKSSDPRWIQFWLDRGQRAAEAKQHPSAATPGAPGSLPGSASPSALLAATTLIPPLAKAKSPDARTPEESVEVSQWEIYEKLVTNFHASNDVVLQTGIASKIPDALKSYWAAVQARQRAEVQDRRYVPAAEFHECAIDLGRASALLQTMDLEVANKANPNDPATAREAIKHWFNTRWNPTIEAAIALFTQKVPEKIEAALQPITAVLNMEAAQPPPP